MAHSICNEFCGVETYTRLPCDSCTCHENAHFRHYERRARNTLKMRLMQSKSIEFQVQGNGRIDWTTFCSEQMMQPIEISQDGNQFEEVVQGMSTYLRPNGEDNRMYWKNKLIHLLLLFATDASNNKHSAQRLPEDGESNANLRVMFTERYCWHFPR